MKHLIAALFVSLFGLSGQTPDHPAYLNPDLTAEQRAADLVSRMTLDEKVLQMQNSAPAMARLNIPAYDWWNEALHGVARAGEATVFPQAVGTGATWDTDLMRRIADTISTEARAKYNEAIRNNNHGRYTGSPSGRRTSTSFAIRAGAAARRPTAKIHILTGRMAVAFITGMQGDDPHYYKVIATAKHYAVHSGPETTRHEFDAKPSERDLNDTYLPAFRAAIVEGKADSRDVRLQQRGRRPSVRQHRSAAEASARASGDSRDTWSAIAVRSATSSAATNTSPTPPRHRPSPSRPERISLAATNISALVEAVKQGLIEEAEINRVSGAPVHGALQAWACSIRRSACRSPRFPIRKSIPTAHRKIALEAARKAIVLLKNENATLPLKSSVRRTSP